MSTLPLEIEYEIMSFLHDNNIPCVCKYWKEESDRYKKAAGTISDWYSFRKLDLDYRNKNDFIRDMIINYPPDKFIKYPETTVFLMGISKEIVDALPPINIRKRSDVVEWMRILPVDYSDWVALGW